MNDSFKNRISHFYVAHYAFSFVEDWILADLEGCRYLQKL